MNKVNSELALIDLNSLENFARRATPGPWRKGGGFTVGPRSNEHDQTFGMVMEILDVYGDNREADTMFIAALNPAVVLNLIQKARGVLRLNKSGPVLADQWTVDAIGAAIAYGRMGSNPPPSDDHWMAEYWKIGQQLAAHGKTSSWDNVTPVESGTSAEYASTAQARSFFSWLDRASNCGSNEIEKAAEVMKDYYQGVGPKFSEAK